MVSQVVGFQSFDLFVFLYRETCPFLMNYIRLVFASFPWPDPSLAPGLLFPAFFHTQLWQAIF